MSENVQFNVMVSPEIKRQAEELCSLTFRNRSDLVEWLISQAYVKLIGQPENQPGNDNGNHGQAA